MLLLLAVDDEGAGGGGQRQYECSQGYLHQRGKSRAQTLTALWGGGGGGGMISLWYSLCSNGLPLPTQRCEGS